MYMLCVCESEGMRLLTCWDLFGGGGVLLITRVLLVCSCSCCVDACGVGGTSLVVCVCACVPVRWEEEEENVSDKEGEGLLNRDTKNLVIWR